MDSKEARELFEADKNHWSENYKAAGEDLRFSVGEGVWEQKDLDYRKNNNMPSEHIPQLPQFIHQVSNDIRMNTPHLDIIPVGDSDVETAHVRKGLVKAIEYRSGADAVYDIAADNSVRCGLGWLMVDHDYCDDESDEQEILIKAIHNPLSAYIDCGSIEPDGSDATRGTILEQVSKKDFEARYPDRAYIGFESDGVVSEDDFITLANMFIKEVTEEAVKGKKRKKRKTVIRRYKFSGEGEALEETTFPGKYIPLVPVYGEVVWVDGKRRIQSLIRNAKGAQRLVDFLANKEIEILSKASEAPWMAAEGQTEDYAEDWKDPKAATVLRYKTRDLEGNPIPPPQRVQPPSIPTGIVQAKQAAIEGVKQSLGMYNASIGARSNETSGKAIDARKVEGEVATYHFGDNLTRSQLHLGVIIDGMIPTIYDTTRTLQIIGEEDEPKMVGVNGAKYQEGQKRDFDLTTGKYDVRITTKSSFTTMRQEGAAFLSEIMKGNPELMQIGGDILFKNMDIPGAQALAERFKKAIPPQLREEEEGEQPVDPEKMQMGQMIQQLQAQLQQLGQEAQQSAQSVEGEKIQSQLKQLSDKGRELKLLADLEEEKLKNQQLQMEKRAMELDRQLSEKEQPAPPVQQPQQQVAKLDTTGFQFMRTPEEEARLASESEQSAIMEQLRREEELAEKQEKQQMQTLLLQGISSVAEQLNQLTQQVSQPKRVIRDENGIIQGVN